MIKKIAIIVFGCLNVLNIQAQNTAANKQRLDFAKMYFEGGGTYLPSFTGKHLINGQVHSFDHSSTINPYLTWGAFHFWGHTEFYVTFPLNPLNLNKNDQMGHQLLHSVATGARLYPWAMKEGKIRPYIGANWGALEFKQKLKPVENQPTISKDIMFNYDAGLMYNYKKMAVRLGINYFTDNTWLYPLSKTQLAEIVSPQMSFQVGLLYTFDASKDNTKENIDKWNSYPRISKLSYDAKTFGDFFVGIGPSLSFSLSKSEYNAAQFPYLQQKITSATYFDLALGYHFNKANLFTAVSYRSPSYKTEGFGSSQTIKKTSVAWEINKFLTDYSGFAPYIGLNLAYDKLDYEQTVDGIKKQETFTNAIEPGITFGWDIVPGKTNEALILRTNLRWYPFSEFELEGKMFNFSQLEYNLIQVVVYPQRLRWRKK